MVQKSLTVTDDQPVADGAGHVSLRASRGVIELTSQSQVRRDGGGKRASCSMRAAAVDPSGVKFQEPMPVEQDVGYFWWPVVGGRGPVAPGDDHGSRTHIVNAAGRLL